MERRRVERDTAPRIRFILNPQLPLLFLFFLAFLASLAVAFLNTWPAPCGLKTTSIINGTGAGRPESRRAKLFWLRIQWFLRVRGRVGQRVGGAAPGLLFPGRGDWAIG